MPRILKEHVLAVRISEGDWKRLKLVAQAEGCKTPSRYVRKILSIGTHTLFDRKKRTAPRREPKRPGRQAGGSTR